MAKRRMFSLDIVDTDAFLDLPASSQNLYFHLGMRADDDGFISSPKRIAATVNASADDLKLLVAKGFISWTRRRSGRAALRELPPYDSERRSAHPSARRSRYQG